MSKKELQFVPVQSIPEQATTQDTSFVYHNEDGSIHGTYVGIVEEYFYEQVFGKKMVSGVLVKLNDTSHNGKYRHLKLNRIGKCELFAQ